MKMNNVGGASHDESSKKKMSSRRLGKFLKEQRGRLYIMRRCQKGQGRSPIQSKNDKEFQQQQRGSGEGTRYAKLIITLEKIESMFPKDPWLKYSKSKYKEEGHIEENITDNKKTLQGLLEE
ncbi:hypothetical protein H5410_006706 [Solanum commersonii]|uniref:Uncharacterized protein n=1 Tax=Solanum commersonii TaxID=4109 RepID=A0A9J6AAJ3_SOLCO|nr:hypothetical protein H5410_006706 [Solanum commersonii]